MIKSLLRHGRGLDLLHMPDKDGLLPLGLAVAWNYLSVATELLNFVKYATWEAYVGPCAARHLLLMSCRSQHVQYLPPLSPCLVGSWGAVSITESLFDRCACMHAARPVNGSGLQASAGLCSCRARRRGPWWMAATGRLLCIMRPSTLL